MKRRSFQAGCVAAVGCATARSSDLAILATTPVAGSAPSMTVDASFFGMHFHRLVPQPPDRTTTPWPATPLGSVRLWDSGTRWADIAPAPGRWNFDRLDGYVELAERHDASLLCTLGSTPKWASARPHEPGPYGPGCAAEPKLLSDWDDYVRQVMARYRGRIAAYEIWNEPYFSDYENDRNTPGFFSGTTTQMIELTRLTRKARDELDSKATLLTPAFVGSARRLDEFLAFGGAALVDAVAFHFYEANANELERQILDVRKTMGRHGLGGAALWNTEFGAREMPATDEGSPPRRSSDGEARSASQLAQFMLLSAALRLKHFYYYAWDNGDTGLVGRAPGAAARREAFDRVQSWLSGTTVLAPVQWRPGAFRIDAERAGERLVFAWSEPAGTLALRSSAPWNVHLVEGLSSTAGYSTALPFAARRGEVMLGRAPVCVRLVRTAP